MNNNKSKNQKVIVKWLTRLFLILVSVIMLYPFIWNIVTSFKTNTEFLTDPFAWPQGMAWDNYARALVKSKMADYIGNSALVVVMTLSLTLIMAVPCSYALVRYKFFGSRLIMGIFMTALFISGQYIIIPLFLQMNKFHMLNSLIGISVVYATFRLPEAIFLLSGYMATIPHDYEEAANLDGCSVFGVFRHIVVPMARPGIATISLLTVMSAWNEYAIALVALQQEEKKTLPVGIANLYEIQQFATDWTGLFAALVLALIPSVIVFLVCEKQLLKGITVGGLKG